MQPAVQASLSNKNFFHLRIFRFLDFSFERSSPSADATAGEDEVFTVTHYLAVDLISEVWKTMQAANSVSQQPINDVPLVLGVIISTSLEHEVNGVSGCGHVYDDGEDDDDDEEEDSRVVKVMRLGVFSGRNQVVLTKTNPPRSPPLRNSSGLGLFSQYENPQHMNSSKMSVSRFSPQSFWNFSSPFAQKTDSGKHLSLSDAILEEKSDDSKDLELFEDSGVQPFQPFHLHRSPPIQQQAGHLQGSIIYNRLPKVDVSEYGLQLPTTPKGSYVKSSPGLYLQNFSTGSNNSFLADESEVHIDIHHSPLNTPVSFIGNIDGFYRQEQDSLLSSPPTPSPV
jgi:hypothetical protein